MTSFPDLADYRIVLVDDRAETTGMISAIFSAAGVALTVATAIDAAARLIRIHRPNVVLVATAIAGEPFAVVEAAHHDGIPVLALDLGSAGPEISDRLGRTYGVAVVGNVDEPEALCYAAKHTADRGRAREGRGESLRGRLPALQEHGVPR
jgi:hypothetical protein